jgi:nicotinamide-nucleotide amidase
MQQYQASLIAIGNELVFGSIVDTNSAFLSQQLYRSGIRVKHICLVEDRLDDIVAELRREAERSDILFTTGGLGPTSDDLTRHSLALVSEKQLLGNEAAQKKLEALFAARKRPLSPNNYRQVEFPEGAEIITNSLGTADAFVTTVCRADGTEVKIISLPGVPRELEHIYHEQLHGWLDRHFPTVEYQPVIGSLRCFGCSESFIGARIEELGLGSEIEVAYRPMFPEILLSFTHRGKQSRDARQAGIASTLAAVRAAIGEAFLFSDDPTMSLPVCLGRLLKERGLTLAAAESCSGGLIAHSLVSQPGASSFFSSSVTAYSNEAKSVYLGVRPAILSRYGAVSGETAVEMARGAKYKTGADFGVSVTGIAGPDGGTEEKPVGTFWIGLVTKDFEQAFPFFFPYERNLFRQYCATLALDMVRRKILGFPLSWERK